MDPKKPKKRKSFDDQMLEFEGHLLLGDGCVVDEDVLLSLVRRYKIAEQIAHEVQRLLREANNGADVNGLLADLHMKYRMWAKETGEVEE